MFKLTISYGSDVRAAIDAGVKAAIERVDASSAEAAASGAGGDAGAAAASSGAPTAEAPSCERWGFVQPIQLAALVGYGRDVARTLTASSALAHDADLLYALLVPSKSRKLAPSIVYADAVVPLLHAAASLGRTTRVRELLCIAAGDKHLLEKRDARGRTPITAAAAAGEASALAVLLGDVRATRELIAAEGIDTKRTDVDGVPLTAFAAACDASSAEGALICGLMERAEGEALSALFAPRPAGVPVMDAGAIMSAAFERLYLASRGSASRLPTAMGAIECARLLFATGAVDPGFKTCQGSALQELKATPQRAAIIRGARPTQLAYAFSHSKVREAIGEEMLADPRCTRAAIASHWLMLRTSAFWSAVEGFGELESGDNGDPQPRFLAHDVEWWKRVLAGGEKARAALDKADQRRLDAYKLICIMTRRLRPDTVEVRRPAGPFYSSDGSDGPGFPETAQQVCLNLKLGKIEPIIWAPASPLQVTVAGGSGEATAVSKLPETYLSSSLTKPLTESGAAALEEFKELVAAFSDEPGTFRGVNEVGEFSRDMTKAEAVEWLLTLPGIDDSSAAEIIRCTQSRECSVFSTNFALFYNRYE